MITPRFLAESQGLISEFPTRILVSRGMRSIKALDPIEINWLLWEFTFNDYIQFGNNNNHNNKFIYIIITSNLFTK